MIVKMEIVSHLSVPSKKVQATHKPHSAFYFEHMKLKTARGCVEGEGMEGLSSNNNYKKTAVDLLHLQPFLNMMDY